MSFITGIFSNVGQSLTDGVFQSIQNNLLSSKPNPATVERINEYIQSFQIPLIFKSIGKELGTAYEEMGTPINESIGRIAGEFAKNMTLHTLPYVALGLVVTTGVPLTLHYVYQKLKHNIGRPKLIKEEKRTTIHSRTYNILTAPVRLALAPVSIFWNILSPKKMNLDEIKPIFNEEISDQIEHISKSLKNIHKHGGYMQNVLLYGPGGTGKTMIAKAIARSCGWDYVMMSGGDLAQYIGRGEHVTELNKLIESMKNAPRPTILFIDECEGLAGDRRKKNPPMSAQHLELLNAFLNHTGESNQQYAIVMATNCEQDLDDVVLNRMDYKIYIGPPALTERIKILKLYATKFFTKMEQKNFFAEPQLENIAKQIEGFTGRTIFKMLNDVFARKAGTNDNKLNQKIVDQSIQVFIKQEKELEARKAMHLAQANANSLQARVPVQSPTHTNSQELYQIPRLPVWDDTLYGLNLSQKPFKENALPISDLGFIL